LIVSPQVLQCAEQYGLTTHARILPATTDYTQLDTLVTYAQNYALWDTLLRIITPDQLLKPEHDLHDFQPDEHRTQTVLQLPHITIINDSKSTIPAAAQAALDYYRTSTQRIVWIVGGISKGVDRVAWLSQLHADQIELLITFGAEAPELAQAARAGGFKAQAYADLSAACLAAWQAAQEISYTQPVIILFSPAGASYDLFSDYKQRGKVFTQCMKQLALQHAHIAELD
jgi:UDP-N-acetylmuramoylalanine-D-glutamate ligase